MRTYYIFEQFINFHYRFNINRIDETMILTFLLGYESSKTTAIYTHVTTKGFEQIKSPLVKLKFLKYYHPAKKIYILAEY